mmetsp:Transcript_37797/g.87499  ORF Transcript_37797/g.87499 Transcript_37797/m.87499 type:complete len:203 (+) Transcript_37797:801-1409(+)
MPKQPQSLPHDLCRKLGLQLRHRLACGNVPKEAYHLPNQSKARAEDVPHAIFCVHDHGSHGLEKPQEARRQRRRGRQVRERSAHVLRDPHHCALIDDLLAAVSENGYRLKRFGGVQLDELVVAAEEQLGEPWQRGPGADLSRELSGKVRGAQRKEAAAADEQRHAADDAGRVSADRHRVVHEQMRSGCYSIGRDGHGLALLV